MNVFLESTLGTDKTQSYIGVKGDGWVTVDVKMSTLKDFKVKLLEMNNGVCQTSLSLFVRPLGHRRSASQPMALLLPQY